MAGKPPTPAVEDYLKALHHLGGDAAAVEPAKVGALLNVRASSVTGMLKRLAESGYVDYEARGGAKLTEAGVIEARRVIRRHRLVELFLANVLGLDWSEVDAEAEALEHAISPRLEAAIAAHLGEPLEDPHGHPIPTSDGHISPRDLKPLADFPAGAAVTVREAQDDDPRRLRRWRELGLVPGAAVSIVATDPLDGCVEVCVGAGPALRLGREALAGLKGEIADSSP